MSSDNIEKLYQNYGILADAKEDISKHEAEYLEILAAVKGSDKEKRLASQFIAKFFKHFPNLSSQALEAQFDLCEEEDVAIRKQAIKDLPSLCKDHKEHTSRIADILAQLLQTNDPIEANIVTSSLLTILKNDTINTLSGLFSQIHQAVDAGNGFEIVRERCIKFLATHIKQLGREVITEEAEDIIIAQCKNMLQDVVANELDHIMEILTWSKLGKTPAGRKQLVEFMAALAFTPDDWQPQDPDYVNRLIQCTMQALPLLSSQVDSTKFVDIFCTHVLQRWEEITSKEEDTSDPKLELLKILAEVVDYCGELEKPEEKIDTVYNLLMTYLPEAPVETETESEETKDSKPPSLQFSHVECALYVLHSLCRRSPGALSADPAKLKALRLRLQYTARLTQGYIKKLKEVTQGKKGADANTEENQLKLAALKTTSNINTLIRDIFRTPASFKSRVQLSFLTKKEKPAPHHVSRPSVPEPTTPTGQKRHQPITFDNGNDDKAPEKRPRGGDGNVKMYTPPSGKYSSKIGGGGKYSGTGNPGRFRSGFGRRDFRNTGAPFRRRSNY